MVILMKNYVLTILYKFILKIENYLYGRLTMMVSFIARKVEERYDTQGLEAAQTLYRAYFVRKSAAKLYGKYQDEVDTILTEDGYEELVTE